VISCSVLSGTYQTLLQGAVLLLFQVTFLGKATQDLWALLIFSLESRVSLILLLHAFEEWNAIQWPKSKEFTPQWICIDTVLSQNGVSLIPRSHEILRRCPPCGWVSQYEELKTKRWSKDREAQTTKEKERRRRRRKKREWVQEK